MSLNEGAKFYEWSYIVHGVPFERDAKMGN